MSDRTPDTTATAANEDRSSGRSEDGETRTYLLKAALVVLSLVAVAATFQFYLSAVAAIDEWAAPEYRPVFRAAFNLVVVLAAGLGISLVVRELAG